MEEIDILKKAGLNEAQALVYEFLLKSGASTPAEIATATGQSRENCYAVAKKLVELGIAEQIEGKKASYRVLNPSALEALAEKRRKIVAKNEKFVKDNISSLLDIFYTNNEMPGSRTLEGLEGIKELYRDILRTKKDVYFLRTESDVVFWEKNKELVSFLENYRKQKTIMGIHTYALTPTTPSALRHMKSGIDNSWNFSRVLIPQGEYTAPTEIQVYGDKVALVAYSETEMATIITSPAIAEAMRQILIILMKFYEKNSPES